MCALLTAVLALGRAQSPAEDAKTTTSRSAPSPRIVEPNQLSDNLKAAMQVMDAEKIQLYIRTAREEKFTTIIQELERAGWIQWMENQARTPTVPAQAAKPLIGSSKAEIIQLFGAWTRDPGYEQNVDAQAIKFHQPHMLVVIYFNTANVAEGVSFLSSGKFMGDPTTDWPKLLCASKLQPVDDDGNRWKPTPTQTQQIDSIPG